MNAFALFLVLVHWALASHQPDPGIFQFTQSTYNLSISEKWELNSPAWTSNPVRVGVYLPSGYDNVKFKAVQGDGSALFKLTAKKIGDFAFLVVSLKDREIVNRELQDEYELVIKASARKKREGNFEAQCIVNVRVVDDNDILPFFRDPEYKVDVDNKLSVNSKLVQLRAVDADSGLNGELLYSFKSSSEFFYIEPRTGWIRSYKTLVPGTYTLTCSVEDRASRLLQKKRPPGFNSQVTVTINVRDTPSFPPILSDKTFLLKYYTKGLQKAALLELSESDAQLDLSTDVLDKGNTVLERVSAKQYLLYVANVAKKAPESVSLILKDNKNKVYTAENITLTMDSESRKVWFHGATEEETPRVKVTVYDDMVENTVVHRFEANTSYVEDANGVKYRIHGKESSKVPFFVEKNTGILRVKGPLGPLSSPQIFEFSIVAKLDNMDDRTEKAFIDVFVTVTPRNLKCPKVTNIPKNYRVNLKDTKVGQVIFTPKSDIDNVIYKLQYAKDEYCRIENGNVILSKSTSKPFQVSLMAINKADYILLYTTVTLVATFNATERVTLTGNVTDTCLLPNLHKPTFGNTVNLRTTDTVAVGTKVGKITAKDKDYGINGIVRYLTPDPYFNIDFESGEITVIRPIQHLTSDVYSMTVEATDMAYSNRKTEMTTVDIQIQHSNLHSPVFEKANYYVRIKEEQIPDGELLRLKAVDEDSGANGRVEYRIAVETELASVDPDTGAFRIERALDRELQPSYTFQILAIDRGLPPQYSMCNVTVILEDVNDNAPSCLKTEHDVRIYEDIPSGVMMMCVAATDSDHGLNGKLKYGTTDSRFTVDSESGCIFTMSESYEEHAEYRFNVTVTDHGDPQKSTECPVRVTVDDVNQNLLPPIFSEAVYEAVIDENTVGRTKVATVKATDPEQYSVAYRIAGGDGIGLFTVDRYSGGVYAEEALDAEDKEYYWLAVEARDVAKVPLSTVTFVIVKVVDVNDHVPLFSQPVYYGKIAENSEANKVVVKLNATDGDRTQSTVKYSIERGNVQSNFLLDENTGFLVTGRRHLDRETQPVHELYVKACDSAPSPRCSTVLVLITVLDENDNAPKFKQTAVVLKIPANKTGFLTRIFADDADEDGPNSIVSYSFEHNTDSRFSIDEYGRFSTSEPLKAGSEFKFTVAATDSGEKRLRSDTSVTLNTVAPSSTSNSTNNRPVFRSPEKWRHLYASDRDTVGTVLGRVEVEDADDDPLWYDITNTFWNPNGTFTFYGNNGELLLARRVNLIDLNLKTIELEIVVSDGWVEIYEKLYIHITRSLHNRPVFDQLVAQVDVPDDFSVGYVLHQLNARVNSSHSSVSHGDNVVYNVHMIDDALSYDCVKVDSATGALILEKTLPRAMGREFTVVVTAKANGGLENMAMVNFRRLPVNLHTPRCVDDTITYYVDDSNVIGQVLAYDLDIGVDGEIGYQIEGGKYNIDNKSGLITTEDIVKQNGTILVKVADKSKSNARSTICTVNVIRKETYDILTFKQSYSNLVVDTNTYQKVPSRILEADSNQLTTFGSSNCKFIDIGFGNGVLQQASYLGPIDIDRSYCTIFGQASDQSIYSNLSVTVKASKDDRSEQVDAYGYIRTDAVSGSYVYRDVNMTEKLKLPSESRTKIISPQERYFGVDNKGFVYAKDIKGIEANDYWSFLVGIQKYSELSVTLVNVHIHLVATNKRAPVFKEHDTFYLTIPAYKNTQIGTVQASDPDGDIVKYAVRTTKGLGSFVTVDRDSGEIVLKNDVKSGVIGSEESLEIIASDGIHTTTSKVRILINGDHQTLKCRSEYTVKASENYTSVQPKLLTWLDWPMNAESGENFRFRLLNDASDNFKIDDKVGILYLNGKNPLDREQNSEFDLTVKIVSLEKSERYCQTVIHITVDDVNDCIPEFQHLPYEIWLSEDVKEGERLLTVKAKDDDVGLYGNVRYSLDSDAQHFLEINKIDGKIKLKEKLTSGEAGVGTVHRFHVIAQDQGNPPLESKAEVNLHITDRNQPIFSHTRYTTRISEASAPGTTIFNVHAKSNTNGTLAYVIVAGDPLKQFNIDFFSGRITVNSELDREAVPEYILEIKAVDLSRKGINATAYVKVSVDDVNDTPPRFLQPIYEFEILENSPEGTLLGQVNATDADTTPPSNVIKYGIVEGDKDVISIDSTSGLIYLVGSLDFENKSEFEWIVKASDSDDFSSQGLIRLTVRDENDNAPTFLDVNPYQVTLTSDESNDQFIHWFKVTDKDTVLSPPFKNHEFRIFAGDETLFTVTRDGALRRIRPFDATELDSLQNGKNLTYKINVTVSDGLFVTPLDNVVTFVPSNKQLDSLAFDTVAPTVTINQNMVILNKTVVTTLKANGGHEPITYSALVSSPFLTVNPDNGNLYLSNRIPNVREDIQIPFLARDTYNNIAVQKLTVHVEANNENTPMFVAPKDGYSMFVSSASMDGDRIGKILAVDDDENDILEYSFTKGVKSLTLDPKNGYIMVKKATSLSDVDVKVSVSDRNNPPHTSSVNFNIKVVDGPVPQFSRFHYFFSMSEDAKQGKLIGQLMVSQGEDVKYDIPKLINSQVVPFVVEETSGKITLKEEIDRENKKKFDFVVRVRDQNQRTAFSYVTINVIDVNDNAPVFQNKEHQLSLREDVKVDQIVYIFTANDKDSGENAKVSYELNDNSYFKIDRDNGYLKVKKALDRETADKHSLEITAKDEGGLSSTFSFTINVLDVNDNVPQFDQLMYKITSPIKGLKVGQKIIDFKLSDGDSSEVQNVTVSLYTDKMNGLLEVEGYKVILTKIPTEAVALKGKITAFDGVYSSDAGIEVTFVGEPEKDVCDENEEKIIIKQVSRDTVVKEFDRKAITNHLLDAEKLSFQIVNNTKLVVSSSVVPGNYSLRIRSKLRGINQTPLICLKTLLVTVENSNKMTPQFSLQEFIVHYPENQKSSDDKMDLVLKLDAKDNDYGSYGDINYSIVANDSTPDTLKYFYLVGATGALMARASFDRERHSNFTVKVEVEDGGGLKDYATVKVVIDDTNDNEPQFEQPVYHLKILENEAVDYEILKLIAHDADNNTKLTFYLTDSNASRYISLDKDSGVLKLAKSLDYEEIQRLKFDVIVSDGELNSTTLVDVEVLDVNDNSPRFEKSIYEVKLKEDLKPGATVVTVKATDSDSLHFGKISYSISGDDARMFTVNDNGVIKTTGSLDFENQKIYRLNVKAVDGGTPALSDDCLVTVVVEDVNDNPPVFDVCNLTAVIQEGIEAGQALLRVTVTDNDSEKFGGPFRLEIQGDGASAFTFDPLLNLITTRQLTYSKQNVYNLTVTAYDAGGLSSSCPLIVHVKQQSRHPPSVVPLTVMINTLMGEFNVRTLGTVRASDKDPADMLRYAIVQKDSGKRTSQLTIDSASGELATQASLLPGLHRFNVSVTDGKYTVYSPVTVDISNIDQEALENSVSIRMGGVTTEEYVNNFMNRVHDVLVKVLGVKMTNVRVLSVQDVIKHSKRKRKAEAVTVTPTSSQMEVEVLLTVLRESGGYYRPVYIKQKITEGIARITAEAGLEVTSLTSEICRRDTCSKGECRDRIWLDNVETTTYDNIRTGNTYMFPRFQRTFECICRQGYSGRHCDVAVNQCSQEDVCSKSEMCVPMEDEPSGLECICPPGTKGERCRENTCPNAAECSQKVALSMLGNGYFQMYLGQSIEQRMDISIEFKTASRGAVILHGAGLVDYHVLRVADGVLEYEWDCGSGAGRVRIDQIKVDDGHWHTVRVVRRRRQVQMVLDDKHHGSEASKGMSDVLNLYSDAMVLTFGANVTNRTPKNTFDSVLTLKVLESASEVNQRVEGGLVGCIGRVGLDGFDLPKNPQGLRMYNTRVGCDAQTMGPCLNAPCLNQGQCIPKKEDNSYSCICPQRYTGAKCEIDLNACASSPCPKGIKCHNLYNDFHCSCPPGFTGKTCQMHGDWDPCVTKPCGPFGTCNREKSTFTCSCSDGYGGSFCSERVPRLLPDSLLPGSPQFYILVVAVLLALLLALIIVVVCRRQNNNMNKKPDSDRLPLEDASDPLIATPVAPPVYRNPTTQFGTNPPPRPPRQKHFNSNLPTVEVKPMPSINRTDTPPQPPKHRNLYDTAADLELKPQPPPHRTLPKQDQGSNDTDGGSDYLTMKPVKRSSSSADKNDTIKLYDNPDDLPETSPAQDSDLHYTKS
ncbi:unnamed protein product [Bursaphelenchus okinawaensis]|uniref:Uncharacterized protein n=1 Tax=Bursaphelenchus okinawaensis TaxID=465554 RepID=A0A811LM51_9BILA|nr:unnamed protein product [Bursaphelenchus okinawaensis]CAG9125955.1 unnamed protein product [Bursaphelenchus okinawaensis]